MATIKTGDPEPAAPVDPADAVLGKILAPTGYTFMGESPTFSLTVAAVAILGNFEVELAEVELTDVPTVLVAVDPTVVTT